ncbi:MAG: lipoprotein [Gammaproteobacteria bacterium]
MKNIIPAIVVLFSVLLLTGCEDEPKTPMQVTQAFWTAVETKNIDQLKNYISEKSLRDEYKTENIIDVSNISFGKIVIDGKLAEVETNVVVESDKPVTVPIDTLLVQENELWKVDYHATIDSIKNTGQLSQIFQELKGFSDQLSKEFENSMEELDKAMPEIEKGISDFGEEMKERIPEIQKQFEDITRQLERAWEESLQEDQKPESI